MATQEQIELLLQQLRNAPPSRHFQSIDASAAGMRAILLYLAEEEQPVTAGMISDYMEVSTARVAVLLKKMEAKDLIERARDPQDNRRVMVKLAERGRKSAEQIRQHIRRNVEMMIDRIGMERMIEFAAVSREIDALITPPEDLV